MKTLWIQINCYNEKLLLSQTISSLPKVVPGFDEVVIMVIDDGSTDDTFGVAVSCGVKHIIRHNQNKGLPAAVNTGVRYALKNKADVLINFDADGQYNSDDIIRLVEPILNNRADFVYGERIISNMDHFSIQKKFYQYLGAWVVSIITGYKLGDATSGFRALNREAMKKIFLVGDFASPLENLIQTKYKKIGFEKIQVNANYTERPSKIVKNNLNYIIRSIGIILENVIIFNPLRIFLTTGIALISIGLITSFLRLFFVISTPERPHLTLLLWSIMLFTLGVTSVFFGLTIKIIQVNKLLSEEIFFRYNDFS